MKVIQSKDFMDKVYFQNIDDSETSARRSQYDDRIEIYKTLLMSDVYKVKRNKDLNFMRLNLPELPQPVKE